MLKTRLVTLTVASIAAAFAVAPSAHAATDYFMKFETSASEQPLKGETMDKEFPGAVEISSWDWSAENPITLGSASGGTGAGKAKFNELTVEKAVDTTTPLLFQRLAQGRHFASVEIIARKAGSGPGQSVLPTRYIFQTVFIKSQEQSGDSGDDAPTEKLTFVYGAVAQQAARQTATGAAPTSAFGNWSQLSSSLITSPLPTPYK